jgi:UDP-N-acetyl-D-glucosamine dehydrogenase
MSSFDTILRMFRDGEIKVGILGLGYVGLPLALLFARKGNQTLGFDIDAKKVDLLQRGESYIQYVEAENIRNLTAAGTFEATGDFERLSEPDVLIICVPTPLDEHRVPDLSYISSTVQEIVKRLRCGQLIVLESTTYPGCTREVFLPILCARGHRLDEDFFLAFSPEREDPSNSVYNAQNIPKLVGGVTPRSGDIAEAAYSRVLDRVVRVSTAEVAESAKLLENIFRCVNIALVNEMKVTLDRMGIDIWEVIEAASTKPFGFMPFYPGPGLGGHCIPIDPFYMAWKARACGSETRFIELAGEVNRAMPSYVVRKISLALNEDAKPVRGSRILLLGFSYKKNLGDDRESPAYDVFEELCEMGAAIKYHDPYLPAIRPTRKHRIAMRSVDLSAEVLRQADCVVILTDHSAMDYDMIRKEAGLIVDARNACRRPEKYYPA